MAAGTSFLDRYSDIVLAVVVVAIVGMMIVPLPTFLLDILLTVNISLSVIILLISLYLPQALKLSVFPTVLLITTMYRLALTVSTTRLILANGDAGEVVLSFGQFVARGNYVVGGIVFVILVIVNFIVITKGATRIAEVGARFTLDAIPGKQMSIDADLSAGIINEKEAQLRRRELEEESSFFGSMDGASKFVRGDAIAGLIITAINIVGGIMIGYFRHGMPAGEAADVFVKLSVGDGLVSQIPALLMSVATGVIVTRSTSEGDVGNDRRPTRPKCGRFNGSDLLQAQISGRLRAASQEPNLLGSLLQLGPDGGAWHSYCETRTIRKRCGD